eukprot:Gregarina_sp_Pseudo_9__1755@NODE_2192_length_1105_cov_11253_137899_g2020_i0_p1_GENE_NODE_2192_length_1105_cov_11253_137899_g2020_i0NODE_2192_length_1105_cov_11253_137899_g2020_i0_p1_ORF_typecomplete_len243_score40_50He_PIG/PF05345_12/0_4_NODE_2192_length_1105_cov_11253_137899_g2020_i025753
MKFLTVSSFLCGVLTRAQETPATPVLTVTLETVEAPEDIPDPCPKAVGEVAMTDFEVCHTNLQSYTGAFKYTGQVSAGAWTDNLCQTAEAETSIYLSSDTLAKYLPDWLQFGAATGTYTLTLEKPTTKTCTVSLLIPTNPEAACAAPIEGVPGGDDVQVPAAVTSFPVQATDFADSVKLAAKSTCSWAEFGTTFKAIDATQVKFPFSLEGQATEPTTAPGPDGAYAHLIIGTLFVLPLMAAL